MSDDRAPRPYSTLRNEKIIWIYPGEKTPGKSKRSRPQTDEEFKAVIKVVTVHRGPSLDKYMLDTYGLKRQIVDEEIP